MTKFVAIKIHYDHRKSLPPYLKYSKTPSPEEYQSYLDLFRHEGIGGNGFHECLNFSVHDNQPAKIYLPPTCVPDDKFSEEEFVFFSFTYKYDKELPASIVGVHAAAKLVMVDREPVERVDVEQLAGADRFHYHAQSPSSLTTLITPPISYDFTEGVYTPPYKSWGYGLRYLEDMHAQRIVKAAIKGAGRRLPLVEGPERLVLERELAVLKAISLRYFGSSGSSRIKESKGFSGFPDQEIGYLGEKVVYENEVAYAVENGIPTSEVQWISQSVPQSPYDIKSVRMTDDGLRDHFIEVKSSCATDDSHIYISSGQVRFFEENADCSSFAFVTFSPSRKVKGIRELSFSQLLSEFELNAIKFKLMRRSPIAQ